jgi:post-segregation antitoxin (ccd killing protein)
MGNITFEPDGPKKSAKLSINAELLKQAKQLNINLSQTLEL